MIPLADQYVLDLERASREKDAKIEELENELENLNHKVVQRGGFVEIDDARAKAFLYDAALKRIEVLEAAIKGPVF